MTFVLLGRDAAAPVAIRAWVEERVRLGKNVRFDSQIVEAEQCAAAMEKGRESPKTVDPRGTRFFDQASQREMKLVLEGPFAGWIVYRHPDGQWVTLRKATDEDRAALNRAVAEAHHVEE